MDFSSVSILRIVASFLFAASILLFFVRVGLRILARHNWSYDDTVLLITMTFSAAGYILLFPLTDSELQSSHIPQTAGQELRAAKMLWAMDIIALATIAASKCATILSVLRIHNYAISGKARWNVLLGKFLCYCSLLWGIISIMLLSIREDVGQPWLSLDYPSEAFSRWIGISATSSIIELLICVLVVLTLMPLQMKLWAKMKAFCFLDCRILLIPLSVCRDIFLMPATGPRTKTTQLIADVIAQVIIQYGVISASINGVAPMLKTHDTVLVDSQTMSQDRSMPSQKLSSQSSD